jgi:hypothetical protein
MQSGESKQTSSWWCHLKVENERSWAPAKDVRVLILRLEIPDSSGNFQLEYSGEPAPLQWAFQGFKPLTPTIGPSDRVDLCSVTKNPDNAAGPHAFKLHPLYRSNSLQADWDGACRIAIIVQARALNAVSKPLRVELAWDGKWSDEVGQMKRHLTWSIKELERL